MKDRDIASWQLYNGAMEQGDYASAMSVAEREHSVLIEAGRFSAANIWLARAARAESAQALLWGSEELICAIDGEPADDSLDHSGMEELC